MTIPGSPGQCAPCQSTMAEANHLMFLFGYFLTGLSWLTCVRLCTDLLVYSRKYAEAVNLGKLSSDSKSFDTAYISKQDLNFELSENLTFQPLLLMLQILPRLILLQDFL